MPTKKPTGQLETYERAIDVHTVTSETPTDTHIARIGRSVSERAAAAGPIIRLNTSSAPTTGSAMAVASARMVMNANSIARLDTPLAFVRSGDTELSRSGRKSTAVTAIEKPLMTATGARSGLLTPSTSPKRRA